MTLIERIARWFNPCLHEWKTVTQLKDSEENPRAATIIQACEHCGEVRELTFKAPKTPGCQHRWEFFGHHDVYANGVDPKKGLPHKRIEKMRCKHCGERKDHKIQ